MNQYTQFLATLRERNSPQANVIVRFEDGAVMVFQPPEPPQKCYDKLKPQLGDFIAKSSEKIEI